MLKRLFTDHPASVGETYGEHLIVAMGFAGRLLLAGGCCLLHALLPFLFEKQASAMVRNLNERMVTHRRRARPVAQEVSLTR